MNIHRTGPVEPITLPVKLTGAVPTNTIAAGDLLGMESNKAVPVTSFTWDTDLATTQTAFAAAFAGLAVGNSAAASTDLRQVNVPAVQDGDVEFDCASADYKIGEYIGPAKAAGNALTNTMTKVASKTLAVAVVVKDSGASATRVTARLVNTTIKR